MHGDLPRPQFPVVLLRDFNAWVTQPVIKYALQISVPGFISGEVQVHHCENKPKPAIGVYTSAWQAKCATAQNKTFLYF
jgi:hypothetical protein